MISFAPLKYGIILILLASKPSHSQDGDYRKIDGNLISRMDDITQQVILDESGLNQEKTSVDTSDARNDCNVIEENLISTMKDVIRSENKGLKRDLDEVNKLLNTLFVTLDVLKKNQDAIQLNSEKALMKLEEKLAEDISEAAKNISLEVSSYKEKLDGNDKGSNDEGSNDEGSNEAVNSGTNKLGMKNSCTNYQKNVLSLADTLFHTNSLSNVHEDEDLEKCWKNFYKNISGLSYFISAPVEGKEIKNYCQKSGMKPFIPRTQEEFMFYIGFSTYINNIWYPINDKKKEGHVVLHDGTDYKNSVYKPEKWSKKFKNTNGNDCVRVNSFGVASWINCDSSWHKYRLICHK